MGRLYVGMAADWSLGDLLNDTRDRLEAGFLELTEIAGLASGSSAMTEPEGRSSIGYRTPGTAVA